MVGHAGTFLRQENSEGELLKIKYYDPNENHFFETGELHGRPVADKAEETRINNKMGRIMRGNIEYIHESKIRASVAGNQASSRTNMG